MTVPKLVDLVLLPLRWLERSRGWRRRGLVLLYSVIFTVASLLAWREMHLWRLPNLREPFDVVKYGTVDVPPSRNAKPLYEEARALLKPAKPAVRKLWMTDWKFNDWNQVNPLLRERVEEAQPALEMWRRASDRFDFLDIQPDQTTIDANQETVRTLRELNRLSLLKAASRVDAGDLDGAWTYYRASLRSSRLVGRHGNVVQRLIGFVILRDASAPVADWAQRPGTTPAMLRQAIRDIEACQALTAPVAEMIRAEYFAARQILDHPERWKNLSTNGPEGESNWYVHMHLVAWLRHSLKREPERSQRVLRLITAGVLAQCDRPRWARPKLASEKFMIYQVDSKTPPAVASISPEALAGWAENSGYVTVDLTFLNSLLTKFESEPATFENLSLKMAERAYQIDRGKPAKTYGDLVGEYLQALPEGIEPVDLINPISAP